MRKLSLIILSIVLLSSFQRADNTSPHGKDFKASCSDCHKTDSWKVNFGNIRFNHDTTKMPLIGQHKQVDCRSCHVTLVFNQAGSNCIDCHTDLHEGTTSSECSRCHTPVSWVVNNITQIHRQSRFPLLGAHVNADCGSCHPTQSRLRFEPLGIECYDCHKENFVAATSPNHVEAGYSTNCIECHFSNAYSWIGAGINHDFFPLREGHEIADCNQCHKNGNFESISNACISCHEPNYQATQNPNHQQLDFSTECDQCHTLSPDWRPAEFKSHDNQFFPIYSGKHNGEWNSCADCHTNTSSYGEFSCINCHEHEKSKTDEHHGEVQGYSYNSIACYVCHPTGDAEGGGFDHSTTQFALTGAHTTTECLQCHTNGFAGTSMICSDCHTPDFNSTNNPDHETLPLPNTCETCHTTNPGWKPATFPIHNQFYQLNGKHATIANNCVECHNDNYNNTPNTCVGCHLTDYNQTNDPPHASAQFSTECQTCHNESGWSPSTFNHDAQYFPIYSGKHNGEWNTCADCHTNQADFSVFSCINCHEHNKPDTDNEHQGVGGYSYNSDACYACHPTGDASAAFNHNSTAFPLTGAHLTTECLQCHANGYAGTTTNCSDCHSANYNQASNPNHTALAIPNTCATCHTTEPGWQPATFPIHNQYYALNGAHASISANCTTCHNGNYTSTPNTCIGCHITNYNQTNNPNHALAQFPTDCQTCHTESAWTPSTFNHDGQYFPIYSGTHNNEWTTCDECHTNPSNFAVFTCTTACHPQSQTNNDHQGVGGYQYNSNACLQCHPNGNSAGAFNHNTSPFPLTGGHNEVDCMACHAYGYAGTTMICGDCHAANYNQTTNPNHSAINIPNTCTDCHTTNPGWQPATFSIHNNYYALNGAHAAIANNCATCHNGNYNTTPNTCVGCHLNNYNQTTNPNHATAQFPTDCQTCHTESAWTPSTFYHDGQYFPIYSGTHNNEWTTCDECHTNPSNFAIFTCTTACHPQSQTNNDHQGVNGYQYNSNACYQCHPTGNSSGAFNHTSTAFPLTGAHTNVLCEQCHTNGYAGTTMICGDCHANNYGQTTNPNHQAIGIPNTCADCHTTNPGWQPATFPIHNNYYALTGAHTTIANNCDNCHNGNYNTTPNTCVGCHLDNYNQTTNPNHSVAQFPTECQSCHTTNGWTPSTFDHDGQYFPIYSGTHNGEWTTCDECHNNPSNFAQFTCTTACHPQSQTNNEHQGISGYSYNSNACYQCHPTGSGASGFNHNTTNFPLTGAHNNVECSLCHTNGYAGTTTACGDCHAGAYNQTNNPNHTSLNLSTTCSNCHTTNAGWQPALFPDHNNYYVIQGAHTAITDCNDCHNNNFNTAPNTCVGCHQSNYNQTTNPNHSSAQYPTTCEMCHTQTAWDPSTFNHDQQYFPIYSGSHHNEWDACSDCHPNASNYANFTCTTSCHPQNQTNSHHQGVNGYSYNSNACLNCHPDGSESKRINQMEFRQN